MATVALLIALGSSGVMSVEDLLMSSAATVPIYLGMMMGKALRRLVQPRIFRYLVLSMIVFSSLDLPRKSLM